MSIIAICTNCGRIVSKPTDWCRSCAMKARWSRKEEREKFTQHNKENLRKNWENPEFVNKQVSFGKSRDLSHLRTKENRERCTLSYLRYVANNRDEVRERGKNSLKKIRHKSTDSEDFVASLLDSLGVRYTREYEVTRSLLRLTGPGRGKILDFYLIDYNVDLEVDGSSHSNDFMNRDNIQKDLHRDELLNSIGIKVYRVLFRGDFEELKSNLLIVLEGLL